MKTRSWNWLDEGLLPVLLVLMRTAWLWPWLALLRAWFSPTQQAPVWPIWVIIGVPLLSFFLTERLLPERRDVSSLERVNRVQLGIAAAGVLLLLALTWFHFYRAAFPLWSIGWLRALIFDGTDLRFQLPVQILALASGVYLWLRGVLDGRESIHHEKVWGTFLAGVVALALYLWLSRFGGGERVDVAPWLIVFFGVGMAALAVANLKIAGGWSSWRQGDSQVQANRYWLLSIGVTIFGLLGLGLFLGWVVAPEEVAWLLGSVGRLFGWVGQLLSWIVLGVSFVLFWLIYPIYLFLQSLINNQPREETPPDAQEALPLPTPEMMQQITDPAQTPESFRWIGLVVVLLVIFVIFVLVLRRLRAAAAEEPDEIHESIYSNDLLKNQLAAFWQGLRNRFGGEGDAGPAFADLSGESDTRRTIRAIYQRLLARAAERGHPRQSAQTPLEYAPDLVETWAHPADAVRVITAGYVEARYAANPPDAATAQAVGAAWEEIEKADRPRQS